jgi:hypothetical protein
VCLLNFACTSRSLAHLFSQSTRFLENEVIRKIKSATKTQNEFSTALPRSNIIIFYFIAGRWRSFFAWSQRAERDSFSWQSGAPAPQHSPRRSPNSYYLLHNNKNRCEGTYTCTREETRERSISRACNAKKSRHRRAQPHRFTECLLQPCNSIAATSSARASEQSVSALLLGRLIAIAGADLLRSYFIPDYFSRKIRRSRVFPRPLCALS